MKEGYDHSNNLRDKTHGLPVKIVDYKLSLHLLGHGSMKAKEGRNQICMLVVIT